MMMRICLHNKIMFNQVLTKPKTMICKSIQITICKIIKIIRSEKMINFLINSMTFLINNVSIFNYQLKFNSKFIHII